MFDLLGLDLNNDQLLSLYFECIDKASEIEDVEDAKRMEGMAGEVLSKLLTPSEEICAIIYSAAFTKSFPSFSGNHYISSQSLAN